MPNKPDTSPESVQKALAAARTTASKKAYDNRGGKRDKKGRLIMEEVEITAKKPTT